MVQPKPGLRSPPCTLQLGFPRTKHPAVDTPAPSSRVKAEAKDTATGTPPRPSPKHQATAQSRFRSTPGARPPIGRGNEAHGGHGLGHSPAGRQRRPQAALRERFLGRAGRRRRPRRRRPRPRALQRAPPRTKVTLDPSTKFGRRTRAPKRTGLRAELAPGTSLRRSLRRPARVWGRKAARRPR